MNTSANLNGITFVNDSKGTNIDALQQALTTIPAPIALIAGGYDKGCDFRPLVPLLKDKVARVVLIGAAAEKLQQQFNGAVPLRKATSMEDAVAKAARKAPHGTTVLLSPGCASYDMFRDFEHRGEVFKDAVHRYTQQQRN